MAASCVAVVAMSGPDMIMIHFKGGKACMTKKTKNYVGSAVDLQSITAFFPGKGLSPGFQIVCKTTCRIHVGTPPSPPACKVDGKTRAEFMLVPPGPTYAT